MELPVNPSQLVDLLRAWFHSKDRSVILADDTFIEGENISTPPSPIVGRGRLYWQNGCWYQLDENGTEQSLCNGVWQNWTPTVTQSGAVTVTVNFARYIALADTVILQVNLTITGTGSAGNAIILSGIPSSIQPANTGNFIIVGSGVVIDNGVAGYACVVTTVGADDIRFFTGQWNNFVGADPSFALANNDVITFTAVYERA